MTNLKDLKRGVIEIVADIAELKIDEVAEDATLEDLGVDSLGGLRIVAAVEKKYHLVVDEQEIMKIRTMPDIFSLVERHLPDVE
jgi:acyl carrier protein